MSKNTHLPLYFDMKGKQVIVYGAGEIANRRVHILEDFGAEITVIAPEIHPEIEAIERLVIERRVFVPGEIRDGMKADMILAATDDGDVNAQIYLESRAAGILVNNASDQKQCDFMFPAIIRSGDMVIGVTSGGRDHKETRRVAAAIRRMIENIE